MPCARFAGALAFTVALCAGTLAPSAWAQARQPLAAGKPVVVDTGAANKAEVDVAAAADTVTRVIVSGQDGAAAATLTVTTGGKPVATTAHAFKQHVCVEWPNAAARTCTLAVVGAKAGEKHRCKRIDIKPPLVSGPRWSFLGCPVSFAPVVWFRVAAAPGKPCELVDASDETAAALVWQILAADGSTVRKELRGSPAKWVPTVAERVWVRMSGGGWSDGRAEVYRNDGGPAPVPLKDMDMDLPPDDAPGPGKTTEVSCEVKPDWPGHALFDLAAGVTYLVEVASGAVKDPILDVRDAGSKHLLDWDDDSGADGGCKLRLKFEKAQSVALVIQSMDPAGAGKVKLRVTAE